MADDLALDTRKEADATPAKAFERWQLELKLAKKREKVWREKAQKVLDDYRGKERKANSFPILWANTEILRPALYNSTPKPDVRRRFRQKDMLGKAVSEVMERSVSYCVDAYDIDNCLQNDVLDALLPGRAVTRIRYVPKIKKIEQAAQPVVDGAEAAHKEEPFEGTREEVEYEQAFCDHVQWDDFLHGPGRVWEEVPWEAFKHRLTRDDLIEQFGEEIGKAITLNDVDDEDLNDANKSSDLKDSFKRAEVWEIWDKVGGKVFFTNESYKKGLIYPKADPAQPQAKQGEPPLKLKNFFPNPRPLMLVEDTGNLVPIPLYELYREQAKELDRISARINKIINACRVRFVHDSTLTELKALMDAGDNEGIPTEQARAWLQNGGIEKAIWFMPVQHIAMVLKELYVARDACKQVIYEITGISDIIRGATDPNETLGAQQLKANSSSLRLQRMQREVQRYTRDLIRLLAEVIGENFDPKTLALMTGLQFPTALQKQQGQLMMQQAQLAQQQGQQIPPEVAQKVQNLQQQLKLPSWEEIMAVLRSDIQREYRVDVETDSTVAQSLQQDMEGMREVITAIVEMVQGFGPAVQAGAMSIEAVKSMIMSVARRARMGLEVEDALEAGLQQPKPQDNGEAAKAEVEKARIAAEERAAQREAAMEKAKQDAEAAHREREMQMEAHFRQQEIAAEARAKEHQAMLDASIDKFKALLDSVTKVEVAEISAEASVQAAKEKPQPQAVQ